MSSIRLHTVGSLLKKPELQKDVLPLPLHTGGSYSNIEKPTILTNAEIKAIKKKKMRDVKPDSIKEMLKVFVDFSF